MLTLKSFALLLIVSRLDKIGAAGAPDGAQTNYRKWPQCKKGAEYVKVFAPEDSVAKGERHYEWTLPHGRVQQYICLQCTQCVPGVKILRGCSVHEDTQCSMECAVQGCILDEGVHLCRLPGNFDSISELVDPCMVTKTTVKPPLSTVLTRTTKTPDPEPPHGSTDRQENQHTHAETREATQDKHGGWAGWHYHLTETILLSTVCVLVVVVVLYLKLYGIRPVSHNVSGR